MITFKHFLELSEAAVRQSSGRRSLAPHGPKKDRPRRHDFSGKEQRRSNSDRAALRKAGFRRAPTDGRLSNWSTSYNSPHHETNVMTYKNQSDYARDQALKSKTPHNKGKVSVTPTSERVSKLKQLRKQLGGTRTTKPVHDVSIDADDDKYYSKNDKSALVSRGKSFKKEVQSVPKALRDAGAKPGDKVSATPMGVMPGENTQQGAKKRDKIYTKELGAKMNLRTGKTIGTMRG
jgi:hypothetical protein